jgi:hypothetical protein
MRTVSQAIKTPALVPNRPPTDGQQAWPTLEIPRKK